MNTEIRNNLMYEMSMDELYAVSGGTTQAGGEPDDLAYNITYFAIRTSPIFWLAKYDEWVINKVVDIFN